MIAPSGKQITIVAKDQQAVVVEVGGGLRSYSVGGRELLDGYGADEMSSSGRGQMLIPWPNRLEDGSYEFNGLRYQLPILAATGLALSSLPERQPDPWPPLDSLLEYRAGPAEAVAGIEQAIDLGAIPRPFLDFVEVAVVGIDRAIRVLVEFNVVGDWFGHARL